MKTLSTTLIFIFCALGLVNAQNNHYWQPLSGKPKIVVNSSNTKLAVFTYDRLTIFDLTTENALTTHGFIYDKTGPLFDRQTRISSNSDNFSHLTLLNGKGFWWYLNTLKNNFNPLIYNKKHYIYGVDYKNRAVQWDNSTTEAYVTTPNGKIVIDKINRAADMLIKPNGKYAYYVKKGKTYTYDFTTLKSSKLPTKNVTLLSNVSAKSNYANEIFYFDKKNTYQLNLSNNIETAFSKEDSKRFLPKSLHKCFESGDAAKDYLKNNNYYYSIEVDQELNDLKPEGIKEKPYKVVQYSAETCNVVKEIKFSMSVDEFTSIRPKMIADLEAKKINEEVKKNQVALNAKKAEQDVKEFFINFNQLSVNSSIDMGSVQGRNISNLTHTKTLLGNVNGQVHAIGWIKDCYGESKLLLIAINSYNNTDFRILRVSNKGQNWGHKHIVSVPIVGGKIGAYTTINFQEFGNLFYVKYTKKDIRTNKTTNGKIEAHCGGKWN